MLRWEPVDAMVSSAGDLGFTWGNYVLESVDGDGQLFLSEGKYANVWRKTANGDWRVVLDISNQNELLFEQSIEFDFGGAGSETGEPL